MDLTERFPWRGREVAWDRHGSGPAVVFCHGTPWSSRLWSPYADALAQGHTVHLWDMPGYGQSSMRAGDAVDLGVQGELLAELLVHWGLDAPHVVAHDFGGAVALRALLLHGASYASLALVDVVALRPWGSPFFRLVSENAEVFAALPPAIHRGLLEAYIRGAAYGELTDDELGMLTAPWLTEAGQAAFYRQIAEADEAFTGEVELAVRPDRRPDDRRVGSRGPMDPTGPGRATGRDHPGRPVGPRAGRRPPDPARPAGRARHRADRVAA